MFAFASHSQSQLSEGKSLSICCAGQPITAVLLGGSITAGTGLTRLENSWGSQFFHWIQTTFPHPQHRLVNEAMPAVSSSYIAPCVEALVPGNTDLVIMEFSFNDYERSNSFSFDDISRCACTHPRTFPAHSMQFEAVVMELAVLAYSMQLEGILEENAVLQEGIGAPGAEADEDEACAGADVHALPPVPTVSHLLGGLRGPHRHHHEVLRRAHAVDAQRPAHAPGLPSGPHGAAVAAGRGQPAPFLHRRKVRACFLNPKPKP